MLQKNDIIQRIVKLTKFSFGRQGRNIQTIRVHLVEVNFE